MTLNYGSVCSGIEAASVAWEPLGWQPAFFSEIEKFPSAVLARQYGSNMPGEDYSKNGTPNYGDMRNFKEWPDHGKTSTKPIDLLVGGTPCQSFSIAGLRAGLDDPRGNLMLTYLGIVARYNPNWVLWENVPGVLSSNGGRDFGTFLGALGQLGYGYAYRVLDAQFCRTSGFPQAVPQRRRRVFVVGYLGDYRRAAAVLFDAACLHGDSAPRRKTGQEVAAPVAQCLKGSGCGTERIGDIRGQDTVIAAPVASTLNAAFGDKQGLEDQHINSGAPLFVAVSAGPLTAGMGKGPRGTKAVESNHIIAFDCKGTQVQNQTDGAASTLRSMGHSQSHANAGGHSAVAYEIHEQDGRVKKLDGVCSTITQKYGTGGGNVPLVQESISQDWAVRRLTPTECERLQGFPDGYTAIPWRNKQPKNCPDGPRYKALGNSMAVNVMRVIGERIAMVDALNPQFMEVAE